MSKQLWERHYYTNHDIEFLINSEIVEYDIKSAGLSLAKEFKYLSEETIEKLENMTKADRNRRMGILKINNKQLSKNENNALVEARKLFIKSNNLNVNNIISIKKDAVFVTQRCNNRKFGNIEFVPKNKYTSYMELNRLEFYYNSNRLDVKGIDDVMLSKHEEYMLEFFKTYLSLLESGNESRLKEYITNFVYRYKSRLLDIEYYREFNVTSAYRLKDMIENNVYGIDTIDSTGFEYINISYNYFNYLVPLCTMLI